MRIPSWQYPSYVEPLDTSSAPVYDPSDLAWTPDYPARVYRHPRVYWPNVPAETPSLGIASPTPPFTRYTGRPPVGQVVRPLAQAGAPDQRDVQWEDRLRRHTQQVSAILNSLVAGGYVYQRTDRTWAVRFGPLTAGRAPTAADDETVDGVTVGVTWIDTSGQEAYVCVSDTAGAAVWKKTT